MKLLPALLLLSPLLCGPTREGSDGPLADLRTVRAQDSTLPIQSEITGFAAKARGTAEPVGNPMESGSPLPHDLHVSYGNLGVEGSLAILQLRVFKNDLEEALGRTSRVEDLVMEVSPEMDALFLEYMKEHFVLEVEGSVLPPVIAGSGYDELDREPVWTYQLRYDARGPIRGARITNTILFEVFADQRNVVRVVKFPEGERRAYYFSPGEDTREITFGG